MEIYDCCNRMALELNKWHNLDNLRTEMKLLLLWYKVSSFHLVRLIGEKIAGYNLKYFNIALSEVHFIPAQAYVGT